MGYLGIPERVFYESAHFVDGLLNIQAVVLKPDESVSGPFNLIGAPSGFAGVYFFDFYTQNSDPQGNYLVKIISPTEQIQTSYRFGMNQVPAIDQSAFQAIATQITAAANEIQSLIGSLSSMASPTDIRGIVETADIFAVVTSDGENGGPEVVNIEEADQENNLEAIVNEISIDTIVTGEQ